MNVGSPQGALFQSDDVINFRGAALTDLLCVSGVENTGTWNHEAQGGAVIEGRGYAHTAEEVREFPVDWRSPPTRSIASRDSALTPGSLQRPRDGYAIEFGLDQGTPT